MCLKLFLGLQNWRPRHFDLLVDSNTSRRTHTESDNPNRIVKASLIGVTLCRSINLGHKNCAQGGFMKVLLTVVVAVALAFSGLPEALATGTTIGLR